MKYMKLFRQKFREYPVFSIKDAKLFLEKMDSTRTYTYTVIHNLLESEEIKKITRGMYTFHEDIAVVGFAFSPFYYGLQDALSWRNIWEQEVAPVVVTPRKVRTGLRSFLGRNYLVRHIQRGMFFGLDSIRQDPYWIPVSDPEKTLIDFVYYNERIPEPALKELIDIVRIGVLNDYLEHVPRSLARRVIELSKTGTNNQTISP
jgi:predicted transcriptional regulator of viral defense system